MMGHDLRAGPQSENDNVSRSILYLTFRVSRYLIPGTLCDAEHTWLSEDPDLEKVIFSVLISRARLSPILPTEEEHPHSC